MPVEQGVWRIDGGLTPLETVGMDHEDRLEEILDKDISIADPGWMVIGRQIQTDFGSIIDLLAIRWRRQSDRPGVEEKQDTP